MFSKPQKIKVFVIKKKHFCHLRIKINNLREFVGDFQAAKAILQRQKP
jgi:hypothetical protein